MFLKKMVNKLKVFLLNEFDSDKFFIKKFFISADDGPLRYYYWSDQKNFGDRLMPLIIGKLFPDVKLESVSLDNAELIGVGSLLTFFNSWHYQHLFYNGKKNRRVFWGTGMLTSDMPKSIPNSELVLVRGELTKKEMNLGKDIPVGDPGLLMSLVIPKQQGTDKIMIVPHYLDYDSDKLEKFKHNDYFEILDVRESPEKIIKKISSSSFVMSSSLHGLIIADSYQIPNVLYNISGNINFFKYDDYYSATGGEKKVVNDSIELLDIDYLTFLKNSYQPIQNLEMIQENILESFPFKNMDDVVKWRKLSKCKSKSAVQKKIVNKG